MTEPARILIVDDEPFNREVLEQELELLDYETLTAVDGRDALRRLSEDAVDLILLDIMMPEVDGFEVLRRLKADVGLRHIPVIMISARDDLASVIRCIEAGADDYLPKPFNPTLLRARIKSGLEKKRWMDEEKRQKRFIREAFSRFVAPAVVDELIADPKRLSLGGKRQELTVVFTDLAGFTALIENAEPADVLPVLNRYLDGLCQIVLDHGGTIDKIVGDALHAFFGAPLEQPDHPARAMACVLALDAFGCAFVEEEDARALGFGVTRIGVHTGTAVVGNFGGDAFFDYTAHGDVVNTAARMESVNKHLGTRVCVTGDTARRCPEVRFRPVGTLVLKGKSTGVEAFEPLAEAAEAAPETRAYLEAFRLMEAGDPEAPAAFRRLSGTYPHDPLAAFHARRLGAGEKGSTVVMEEK